MFMFPFHAALSLDLIALTAGTALYAWVACREGKSTCFAKCIGILVILISIISLICTIYCGIRYWKKGYDKMPMIMMQEMMQDTHKQKSMMENHSETSNTTNQKITNQKTNKKPKNQNASSASSNH